MARVLVIGGTLFMGRALVEQLLARGDEVTVLHRGEGTPFGAQVQELRCDRGDIPVVQAALAGTGFEVVYDTSSTGIGTTASRSGGGGGRRPTLQRYVFIERCRVRVGCRP
jgi:nucleoside-diphosphate-sugar epimerase